MTQKHKNPVFRERTFTCPHCGIHAEQKWRDALWQDSNNGRDVVSAFSQEINKEGVDAHQAINNIVSSFRTFSWEMHAAYCQACDKPSFWLQGVDESSSDHIMINPTRAGVEPLPEGASETIQKLYDEADAIATISPRAAAALLRITIEVLCKEILDEQGKYKDDMNLQKMLTELKKSGKFNDEAMKAMDNLRQIGNKVLHEGKIELKENINPSSLFYLVRFVVNEFITRSLFAKRANEQAQEFLDNESTGNNQE